MASRVDLHTHTRASDGTLTPLELLDHAAELAVQVLAITDHDSTSGYDQLLSLRDRRPNIRLIPGIELNAEGESACHLLGYFIDPLQPELQTQLNRLREQRVSRVRAMADKLRELGFAIDFDRLLAAASGGSIGRPHLADALMEKGYVKNRQEAFDRFLKKDGSAYVEAALPTSDQSISLIRRAGGVPVLAHPSYNQSPKLLETLVGQGLMGIEAYYPEHGRSLTRHYLDVAERYGLVATGGSDFHGPRSGRSALACVDVPESVIKALEIAKNRV